MSNYGSMPPTGAYVPPNQGTPAPGQQQQQQQQQPQQQGYGQPGAPNAGQPAHGHKPGGGAFGQIMNQAVTTGKPMFNKLSKTISSKLSGKPVAGPPQHLQSYQNYQEHNQPQGYQQQQQQQQQQQAQPYSPQANQRPWQPPPGPQPPQAQAQTPNVYSTPQQSPYPQASNYGTPASAHSGQSNYFPAQNAQQPNAPPPPQLPVQQGQYGHQGPPQEQYQQNQQWQAGQYDGQQSGVVGAIPSPSYAQAPQAPHMGDVSPVIPPNKPVAQPSWRHPSQPPGPPPPDPHQPPAQQPSQTPAVLQQPPQSPINGQQPFHTPMASQPSYQPVPSPPIQQGQPQQWNAPPAVGSQGHVPPSVSPPPQQLHVLPHAPLNAPSQPSQNQPASQQAVPQKDAPTEFVAELPADMGSLSLANSKTNDPAAQYQAYHPPGAQAGSPTNRFSVARRAVSTTSLPLADPWRFADATTEQPTREFYILADLIFDSLDRKFEPQNTGLLEGSKVLKSWVELSEEAHRLFSYDNYTALARMWSLAGIPHVMVPVQPALTPLWHFNQHSHAQDLKVVAEPNSTYAIYVPALNRAGWYKFFFLEAMHGPDDIYKLLPALCADTYKPGVLNHPDLNRRDRTEMPALQARAAQIQSYAIKRVLDEAKAAMARDAHHPASAPQTHGAPAASSGVQRSSEEETALLMAQIQQQANGAALRAASDDVYVYKPGQSGGYV